MVQSPSCMSHRAASDCATVPQKSFSGSRAGHTKSLSELPTSTRLGDNFLLTITENLSTGCISTTTEQKQDSRVDLLVNLIHSFAFDSQVTTARVKIINKQATSQRL